MEKKSMPKEKTSNIKPLNEVLTSNAKNKVGKDAIKIELSTSLAKAKEDQGKKLAGSSEHFIKQCEVAAAKYETVNGYMQARTILNDSVWDCVVSKQTIHEDSIDLAKNMNQLILGIEEKFTRLTDEKKYSYLSDMLDDYLDAKFVFSIITPYSIAYQLLTCQVLQNLQPGLDDIVGFYESTEEQIGKIEDELKVI